LLRLLLPLNHQVRATSQEVRLGKPSRTTVRGPHQMIQSVVATGGVYKGQGRNQCELMTHVY